MKHLLITSLLVLLTANVVFAAPNYDPNFKTKTYSTEYNDKLFKKLNDEFDKKYPATLTYDKDGYPVYTVNYPPDAYHQEVIVPYFNQKQNEPDYIN